jgi:prepilin signal peptidase PulO-like enzyme (type II secretory pathway)
MSKTIKSVLLTLATLVLICIFGYFFMKYTTLALYVIIASICLIFIRHIYVAFHTILK